MKGIVYNNDVVAGTIEKEGDGGYVFRYENEYFNNDAYPPISLTLPKVQQE